MPRDHTLLVLGATGDLTGRLLLPALARLFSAGNLPERFAFVGAGPQVWDRGTYREHARTRLAEHAADLDVAVRSAFLDTVDYRPVDVLDRAAVAELLERHLPAADGGGAVTLYLALPTHLLSVALSAFQGRTLPAGVRIAVEKPFGDDLDAAMALNATLASITASPEHVFRVDHVLGMPAVQQLSETVARLRAQLQPIDVAEVQILWEETLALEGRASFYDGAGALKDLVQNHLVQILCLITMEPDDEADSSGPAQRRAAALRAVRVPTVSQVRSASRRARYTSGRLATTGGAHGEQVPDYRAEERVDPHRRTETFAEVALAVSAPRWAATRFVLRAGKAMAARRRGVLLRFQHPTDVAGVAGGSASREVWIDVDRPAEGEQPAGSGARAADRSAPLEQLAYMNVLRDVLSGAAELSVSAEETERAWRLMAPVLACWAADEVPLGDYPAGTSAVVR